MSKIAHALLVLTFAAAGSNCVSDTDVGSVEQHLTGSGAPSGARYSLSIIGVDNAMTSTTTGAEPHAIFVALGKIEAIESKIYLVAGDFQVCDGNAFDAAHNCAEEQIHPKGAVFQLRCNLDVPADITCEEGTASDSYTVRAGAFGQPGGTATITVCAIDPSTGEVVCSTENVVLAPDKDQSTLQNVTNELTSLVADLDGDGVPERVALFAGGLEDWFLQYFNSGDMAAQIAVVPLR